MSHWKNTRSRTLRKPYSWSASSRTCRYVCRLTSSPSLPDRPPRVRPEARTSMPRPPTSTTACSPSSAAACRGSRRSSPTARGAAHRRGERGAVVVGVGDGDGQRVGGVVGLRDARQAEDHLGHLLHLDLARASVPGNRLLDLQRRVLAGCGLELRGGQVEDALGLADRQRGLDVDVHEEILEHDDVGREALDEPQRLIVDLPQADVGVVFRGGDDAAVAERREAVALLLDNAPAGARRARIEADDDHGLPPTLWMCPWPGPAAVVTS